MARPSCRMAPTAPLKAHPLVPGSRTAVKRAAANGPCAILLRPALSRRRMSVSRFRRCAIGLVLMAGSGSLPLAGQTITGPAGIITAPPSPLERRFTPPSLAPGEIMIDDMIFEAARLERRPGAAGPFGSSYESFNARPWEFGYVPIAFANDTTDTDRVRFFSACDMWKASGVVCMPRTDEPVWVVVQRSGDGCFAKVGMGVAGPQVINLSTGCWVPGIIAHEIGHALGLVHEHQRPDRDTYVTINYDNIEDDAEDNFVRIVTARMWGPYDFGSLMHYSKTAFAKAGGLETITPKPEYAQQAANLGQRTRVSDADATAVAGVYNLPPHIFRAYPLNPRVFTIGRTEALAAMAAINAYYAAPRGLNRTNGLSLNGRPDFLGLAAWFFDTYVNARYAGYAELEARYHVMAHITQSEEWRTMNPGRAPAAPLPVGNTLPFDRGELLAVMERLDRFYSAPEGLQRPNGLSLNGQPDFLGIAAWVVDVYLGARLGGLTPDAAWQRVVSQIQTTEEWRSKH